MYLSLFHFFDVFTRHFSFVFFFFNDTATTEIYTLSLHDALPISISPAVLVWRALATVICLDFPVCFSVAVTCRMPSTSDRKSTRLNSSHSQISYAVFCLKKKKKKKKRSR